MPAKRWAAAAAGVLLLGSTVFSQSLAEVAQKERARRAALKTKKVVVVTNADLAKAKRKAALEVLPAPAAPAPAEPASVVPSAEKAAEAAAPASAETKPQEAPSPAQAQPPADPAPANLKELQEKWDKAKEYVELLTLKMGALWQEFNGLRDPNAKEAVRLTISETYAKLQTAQEEEAKARQRFEKALGESKKESAPSLWVR